MTVTITYEFEDCQHCPLKTHIAEQGWSANLCGKLYETTGQMVDIARKGILPECPLKGEAK